MSAPGILVVEDDPSASRYMRLALEERFADVRTAASGAEALRAVASRPPDLAFFDLHLPDFDGRELLTLVKASHPRVPIIMVTASGDASTIVDAVLRGAINYLVKPVAPAALLAAATKALSVPAGQTPSAGDSVPELVGASPTMAEVRRLVTLAAGSDVNVLLVGETGTGKELAARAIHRLSGRSSGPFIPHNCATTTPELFDSEFFGHRRGAFTGADRDHVGLLAQANGGILFLDELGSMGLPQQAKLLRVLDDGVVRPVGSAQTQVVNVRFVAATHREPESLVEQGALREDFYYRLLGFEIPMPPLRDRRDDLPALAAHFLRGADLRLGASAMEALLAARWPGNVRQLGKVLLAASATAGGDRIEAHHLPLGPASRGDAPAAPDPAGRTMKDLEKDVIVRALRNADGNRSRAARVLGIDRSTLRRKMRESH